MSRLVSRILLSIFMFPLAGLVFLLVFVFSEQLTRFAAYPRQVVETFLASGLTTWVFVAVYWCLLWKSCVVWTEWRIGYTGAAAGGALIVGAVAGVIVASVMPLGDGSAFGSFLGSVLAIVLWLIATVLTWRETPAERAKRISASGRSTVTCPTCGYNLTGLSESRCPECGSKFTLDELMASQPHTIGEIE